MKTHWSKLVVLHTITRAPVTDELEFGRAIRQFSQIGYANGYFVTTLIGRPARISDIDWSGFEWVEKEKT